MFLHNFKYALKTLFRNKMLIFWTFAFPVILGTLFHLAFSDIENSEKLKVIDIAIIQSEDFENHQLFQSAFRELSDEQNSERLFHTQYTTKAQAEKLLAQGEIVGYVALEDGRMKLTFNTNGVEQTVLKFVTEEIEQTEDIVNNLSEIQIQNEQAAGNYPINYEKIYQHVKALVSEDTVRLKDQSGSHLSYTMIEFYTLIAMTCLYGGMLSMVSINQNLANMSDKGKRIAVSPAKKGTVVLSSLLAGYTAQLCGLAILFAYTVFVLKVDYGNYTGLTILLAAVGAFAGLTLGTFIGTVLKANENTKTGILIAFTMLCCFLSGMMGITMKYLVDTKIPILNKINPAGMITDGFYALYYYNISERYWIDIISLLIFAFLLILASFFCLRRQKYDRL